jgi:hypothetical protein
LPFAHFFESNPILVPIPNSSLVKENTLRVPHRIADAMHENGLGTGVGDMLERRIALPKAATSQTAERPTATQHYRSLEVHEILILPKEILLIDDVVTRGATLFGAAMRLCERYPGVNIFALAIMRAISQPRDFDDLYDPRIGEITFNGENTFRVP